jgi:hypothetical protein
MRDLGHDVGVIARWSPRVVITAMHPDELLELQLEDLRERFRLAAIEWHLLPFPSDGVPWPGFERYWVVLVPLLTAYLATGARIFIHCRDGVHRSGFVAARLLIDLGCRPQDAINRVRAAMPGSIDVPEQEFDLLLHKAQHSALPLSVSGQQELELDVGLHRVQSAVIPLLKPGMVRTLGDGTHGNLGPDEGNTRPRNSL